MSLLSELMGRQLFSLDPPIFDSASIALTKQDGYDHLGEEWPTEANAKGRSRVEYGEGTICKRCKNGQDSWPKQQTLTYNVLHELQNDLNAQCLKSSSQSEPRKRSDGGGL